MKIPLPFQRCWVPELAAKDVKKEDFVAFIDHLEAVQRGPAPLQALNLAGFGLGWAPQEWAMFAGAGMQIAAGIGTTAIIITRTNKYSERVNKDYLGPRGLKVSVKKDNRLTEMLGLQDKPQSEGWPLAPIDTKADLVNYRDRRMAALAPFTAPLDYDTSARTKESNIIDKMSSKQQQFRVARQKKKDSKQIRKIGEAKAMVERMQSQDSDSGSDSDSSFQDSDMEELEQEIKKINLKADSELKKRRPSEGPED
jgi:hypothetical protein